MMHDPLDQLPSPDDLDAWIAGRPSRTQRLRYESLAAYRDAVRAELHLVEQLRALPELGPSPGFADRVLAGVTRLQVVEGPSAELAPRGRPWRAAAAGLAAAFGASTWWGVANGELVRATVARATGALQGAGAATLETLAAWATSVPGWSVVERMAASPAEAAVAAAVAGGLYAGGLVALRRLLAPAAGLAHAGR